MRGHRKGHACPRCGLPAVMITATYVNARKERRHRIEARHDNSLSRDERDQILNTSAVTPGHLRRLLRTLAKVCGQ